MAEASTNTEQKANTAVPGSGDHDRVQMLSLRADGTPDQNNPEIIGDKEVALEAAKEQFRQQAVSAADVKYADTDPVAETPQDPTIEAAVKEHEKVAKAAEKAAEKVVDSLHQG